MVSQIIPPATQSNLKPISIALLSITQNGCHYKQNLNTHLNTRSLKLIFSTFKAFHFKAVVILYQSSVFVSK